MNQHNLTVDPRCRFEAELERGRSLRTLTDEELERLRSDLESDSVERKESLKGDAPTKVREAICAFANDLAGRRGPGVVFIGLRDNGLPVPSFVVTDELLLQLSNMKADGNISPLPSLLVEKRQLGEENAR